MTSGMNSLVTRTMGRSQMADDSAVIGPIVELAHSTSSTNGIFIHHIKGQHLGWMIEANMVLTIKGLCDEWLRTHEARDLQGRRVILRNEYEEGVRDGMSRARSYPGNGDMGG